MQSDKGVASATPASFFVRGYHAGSPLMDSLSKKHKLMAAAIQAFPKLVFQEWLRSRRRSAALWYPGYKKLSRERQVICLDRAIVLNSQMN